MSEHGPKTSTLAITPTPVVCLQPPQPQTGWPKHVDVFMVFKPLGALLGLVFGIIILLKNNISHLLTPILKTLLEFIFQNLSVELCIHSPINLASISHPFPCHTPPHHQGPSSTLQSSFHQLIIESLSFLFPHPLLSI